MKISRTYDTDKFRNFLIFRIYPVIEDGTRTSDR